MINVLPLYKASKLETKSFYKFVNVFYKLVYTLANLIRLWKAFKPSTKSIYEISKLGLYHVHRLCLKDW